MNKANAWKLALLLLIVGGTAYFGLRQRPARPLAIGDRALDFSVPALPSGSLDLKSYRGQVVLLNFWATWCAPCVEETPSLVQFAEKVRGHGVTVVSVSVDQDPKALQDFIRGTASPTPWGVTLTVRWRRATARGSFRKPTSSTGGECWQRRSPRASTGAIPASKRSSWTSLAGESLIAVSSGEPVQNSTCPLPSARG